MTVNVTQAGQWDIDVTPSELTLIFKSRTGETTATVTIDRPLVEDFGIDLENAWTSMDEMHLDLEPDRETA